MGPVSRGTEETGKGHPGFAAPPPFGPVAPDAGHITDYDAAHFIDYARLLDAERAGQDWRAAASAILRMKPEEDEAAVRRCWESHLARAHWISTTGYRQILINAGLAGAAASGAVVAS